MCSIQEIQVDLIHNAPDRDRQTESLIQCPRIIQLREDIEYLACQIQRKANSVPSRHEWAAYFAGVRITEQSLSCTSAWGVPARSFRIAMGPKILRTFGDRGEPTDFLQKNKGSSELLQLGASWHGASRITSDELDFYLIEVGVPVKSIVGIVAHVSRRRLRSSPNITIRSQRNLKGYTKRPAKRWEVVQSAK